MATQILRNPEITRPTPAPLKSSILDHATVQDISRFGNRNNAGLWPSYNCIDTLVPYAMPCDNPLAGADYKTFAVAPWVPGFEFTVYGAVQCMTVGLDRADQQSEITRVFERNEGKGVERALAANRFVASGSDDAPGQWDAPVDLTPGGTPVTITAAIGILEGYAAANYAGQPTLHLPRSAVTIGFALGLLREENGIFYTKTGAKVAAGGGYDSTGAPTDANVQMYVTGEVYVERSETINFQEIVMPGDGSGTGSDENGLADNTSIALVERMYRVGVDCLVAEITGKLWTA